MIAIYELKIPDARRETFRKNKCMNISITLFRKKTSLSVQIPRIVMERYADASVSACRESLRMSTHNVSAGFTVLKRTESECLRTVLGREHVYNATPSI